MTESAGPAGVAEEAALVAALRRGDESAFVALVDRYHRALLRVARAYVRDEATAEEVVQEAWQGLVRGIDRFEGRSSLKTWLFRVLANRARARAGRENRTVPFSWLRGDGSDDEPAVDPARFYGPAERHAGHWLAPPGDWGAAPEERVVAGEARALVGAAIAALPPPMRLVITLRDVEGWTAPEVCEVLSISPGNQRVLLHRARARVRRALEGYFDPA